MMPVKGFNVLVVLNLIALIVLAAFFLADRDTIVFIDSTKVINSYDGMAEARKAYQAKVTAWKANIDTLAVEVQKEVLRYEKEGARMSPREKDLSQELIRTKQEQLIGYQKAVNEQAGQEDATATKKVIDEINAYIKAYGQANGYTIVLAATEYGNIVYAEEYLDITEKVIEGLNKNVGTGMK